ncbi:MAG: FtsH protease activity modulator HflK [Lachnospiraceae bacterium]|nr:FtsH protease activity modulator HflK [Lachnospiraceae bacterium]
MKTKEGKIVVKIIAGVFIGVFLLITIFSSIYTISETEAAVVTTFGKASLEEGKGLRFKIPFIQKVTKVNTTVQGIQIGYSEQTPGKATTVEHEALMITSDYNFIDCDFYISYQVTDPILYLYGSDQPDDIIKNIAMSSIRSVVSAYNVDTAITTGKAEIQSNVKGMIIQALEKENIGITLVDASIQDVEPPTDTIIAAFTAVETAKQGKESAINEANAYRNEQLPASEAKADKILQDANAKKTSRIKEAKGQASRFNSEYAEYKKYPLVTKQRMFLETMEEVLPKLTVIINDDETGSVLKLTDLDKFGSSSSKKSDKSDN